MCVPSQPLSDLKLFLLGKYVFSQDQERDTKPHSVVEYKNGTDGNLFHLIGFIGSEGREKSNFKEVNQGGNQFHS